MTNKKIYIIILNYNSWKDTIETMESVINNNYKNFQIILIDNFSPNDSEIKLKQWLDGKLDFEIEKLYFRKQISLISKKPLPYVSYFAKHILKRNIEYENETYSKFTKDNEEIVLQYPILFVQTGKNLGFAGGNNVVLRNLIASDEDVNILLLNPDTFLDKNALKALIDFNTPTNTFLIGSKIMSYDTPDVMKSIGGNKLVKPFHGKNILKILTDYRDIHSIDYIYGAALFLNADTLRFIGPMPEDYFLYWEETDWCVSAKKKGVLLTCCPDSICYDKQGTSIGHGFVAEYFFTYNSMIFYKKFYKKLIINLLFFHIIRFVMYLVRFKFQQAKAIFFALKDFIFKKNVSIENKINRSS